MIKNFKIPFIKKSNNIIYLAVKLTKDMEDF